jgi:hypothetical protein
MKTRSRGVRVVVGVAVAVIAMPLAASASRGGGGAVDPGDDGSGFSDPTTIDNRWLPLVPGNQFVLEGTANRGQGASTHQVIFTVTDVTKEVNGVQTLAMWDRDFSDGELVEEELAFFAQDDSGAVWNLGEYPEEYEDGEFIGAPSSWLDGVADAERGIHMLADPEVGDSYTQGSAPRIDFLDVAEVIQKGGKTCVPTGCYKPTLVVDEQSPLDPASGSQQKYYAPGVGNIKITAVDDVEAETLELVELNHLDEEEMAEAREAALALDERAYDEARRVWRHTPPAEAPADEVPADEAPADEAPAADNPADEAPASGGLLSLHRGARSGLFDFLFSLLAGRF